MKHTLFTAVCFLAAFALSIFSFFTNLGQQQLFFGDESTHILVMREMSDSGEWSTPTFRSRPYFSKPPLKMWATLVLMKGSPQSLFWYRLPDALLATAGIVFIFLICIKLFSAPAAGLLTTVFLLANEAFLHGHCARRAVQDSTVFFTCTACLYLFLLLRERKERGQPCWLPAFLIGMLSGIAVMTKYLGGLYGLLCGIVYLLLTCSIRDFVRRYIKELCLIALLTSAPLAVWIGYLYSNYHSELSAFWNIEIFQRLFGKGIHKTDQPFFYFDLLYRKETVLPAVLLYPATVLLGYKLFKKDQSWAFLFSWGFFPLILFSLLQSKLRWYLVPSYPAIAMTGALLLTSSASFLLTFFSAERRRIALGLPLAALYLAYLLLIAVKLVPQLQSNLSLIINPTPHFRVAAVTQDMKESLASSEPDRPVLVYNPGGGSIRFDTPLPDYDRLSLLDLERQSIYFDDLGILSQLFEQYHPAFAIVPDCRLAALLQATKPLSCSYFESGVRKSQRKRERKNHVAACYTNCDGLKSFVDCGKLPEKIYTSNCRPEDELNEAPNALEFARTPSLYSHPD